jgi:SAM-dependent methyltransferase
MTERHEPGERLAGHAPCPMCDGTEFVVAFNYDRLMPLEVAFEFAKSDSYWREIHRCVSCGHFVESLALDQTSLYASDYVTSTYGDADGLKRSFEKVMSLPPEQSDNAGRVNCVLSHFGASAHRPWELLDVGSGLCVFAARMREAGWNCTVLDLDPRLVEHAKRVAKVTAHLGDIANVDGLGFYDLITFNKVLEHVVDPVAMLQASARVLSQAGLVYIEVPDGEAAALEGREREEFLLGHRHVFSCRSLKHLIERAGFRAHGIKWLREPSGKYTLRTFAGVETDEWDDPV